ncbi:hypothetical protein GN244_ATG17531 [Phytophthora infestans]|uniref:Uncharacterized protein n=1 Tax=Phytophthora infestans TaxID=4787 RepID=A0A833SJ74_PHYIN|nr:hypothetical protein GN244_ATG17531 [Phytophthora infestans]
MCARTQNTTPSDLLIKWFVKNHATYYRATNLAEVIEEFCRVLLSYEIYGRTIDEIQSQITGMIR